MSGNLSSTAAEFALMQADPERAAIMRRRRMAEALIRDSQSPELIRSNSQGVARLAQAALGSFTNIMADRSDRQLQEGRSEDMANFFAKGPGGALAGAGQGNPVAAALQAPQATPEAPQPAAPMPTAAPRGEAPQPIAQGIAARRALDPNAPDYAERIQQINNGVIGATMPGAAPQPIATQAPMPAAPQAPSAPTQQQMMAHLLLGAQSPNPMIRQAVTTQMPIVQAAIAREENNAFRREESQAQRDFRMQELALRREDAAASRGQSASQFEQQMALRRAEIERGQVPPGYERTPEGMRPIAGGPQDPARLREIADARTRATPMPSHVQRSEGDDLEIIGTASNTNQRLSQYQSMIDNELANRGDPSNRLALGPVQNFASAARNMSGASSPNSQNYASFRADLERLRNDSLRLNTGVQTDGDAQRAWNELINNINDPNVVRQRLRDIQGYNQQAVELRQNLINQRRANYNLPELDTSRFRSPAPAAPNGQQQPGQRPPLSAFGG